MQTLLVKPERVQKAEEIFAEKWATVTDEQRLLVFHELELFHCVYYGPDGDLKCTVTDLQMVALAAAFVAVSETGGQLVDA